MNSHSIWPLACGVSIVWFYRVHPALSQFTPVSKLDILQLSDFLRRA